MPPYADCIYRQSADGDFLYPNWESLWSEVRPAEEGLVAELAARLAALPLARGGTVYAPLGTGHHVDHQVVYRAAEGSGRKLIYYEDFPYAGDSQVVQTAPGGEQWQEELVTLSEKALEARIAAIACYRSQISSFWSDVAEMAAEVRAFAEQAGGGRLAERYWKSTLL